MMRLAIMGNMAWKKSKYSGESQYMASGVKAHSVVTIFSGMKCRKPTVLNCETASLKARGSRS